MPHCPYCHYQQVKCPANSHASWWNLIGRQPYYCHDCQHNFSLSIANQGHSHDTRVLKEVGVMLFVATILVSFILLIGYIELTPAGIRN